MQLEEIVSLTNRGIKFIYLKNGSKKSNLAVFINSGFASETDEEFGWSHQMEHLVASGRGKRYNWFMKKGNELADSLKIHTSYNYIFFNFRGINDENLQMMPEYLNKYLFSYKVEKKFVQLETKSIMTEMDLRKDKPHIYSLDSNIAYYMDDYPIYHTGFLEQDLWELQKFYDKNFVKRNTMIVYSGSLSYPFVRYILNKLDFREGDLNTYLKYQPKRRLDEPIELFPKRSTTLVSTLFDLDTNFGKDYLYSQLLSKIMYQNIRIKVRDSALGLYSPAGYIEQWGVKDLQVINLPVNPGQHKTVQNIILDQIYNSFSITKDTFNAWVDYFIKSLTKDLKNSETSDETIAELYLRGLKNLNLVLNPKHYNYNDFIDYARHKKDSMGYAFLFL